MRAREVRNEEENLGSQISFEGAVLYTNFGNVTLVSLSAKLSWVTHIGYSNMSRHVKVTDFIGCGCIGLFRGALHETYRVYVDTFDLMRVVQTLSSCHVSRWRLDIVEY